MSFTRRRFLEGVAAAGAAWPIVGRLDAETNALPTRTLGKTGARVSILAMGGGSRYLMYKDEDAALEAATKALDAGIVYQHIELSERLLRFLEKPLHIGGF